MSTIIITGANGFIGKELIKYFYSKDNKIIAFARKKPEHIPDDVEFFNYDLSMNPPEEPFSRADFIIHAAFLPYSLKNKNSSEINLTGTKQLLQLTKKYSLKKFVYFSSFSAHQNTRSNYGISKFEIEKIFDQSVDLILKPGLVLGNGGIFNSLRKIISSSKIIPVFAGGNQKVQTICIHDLIKIIDIALEKNITGIFPVANENILTMKEINLAIAKQAGKNIKLMSIPYAIGFIILSIAGFFKINLPISKENLLGLKYGITYDTKYIKKVFNIDLLSFEKCIKEIRF